MSVHALDRRGTTLFAIEPVVGWRVWRLQRVDGRLRLVSVTRNHAWPAAEAIEATCWLDHGATGVPHPRCTCGIYAASEPDTLGAFNVISAETCVVGAIAMWGSVVEHTRGARSRFAYPARLHLVCGRCLSVGFGAVAPVRVREWDGVVTATCERHEGGFLSRRAAADVQQELLGTYVVDLLPFERLRDAFAPAARTTRHPLRSARRALADVVFGGV